MVNIINMTTKQALARNILNFWRSAELVYKNGDWTSACTLYFKALFVIIDYILLLAGHDVPKDHGDRFRTIERHFPRIYKALDRLYPIYRNTYSLTISKRDCDEVRRYVKRLIEEHKIQG